MTNESRSDPADVRSFVKSAWSVLLFQLVAAVAAVAITVWAVFSVQPLLERKEQLTRDVATLRCKTKALNREVDELHQSRDDLARELQDAREQTAAARRSVDKVRYAINSYHQGAFERAVQLYDEALELDPKNAYIHDLKSYSQFRLRNYEGAIDSIETALSLEPGYIYGFPELSMYLCAARRLDEALAAYERAVQRDPLEARSLYAYFVERDRRFRRHCHPLLSKFR